MTGYNPVTCGECSLCCKLMSVDEIGKKSDKWCRHCTKPGCAIYADRPGPCATYRCLWLISQEDPLPWGMTEGMALDYKPSVSGVVLNLTDDGSGIVALVNAGRKWGDGIMGKFLRATSFQHRVVIVEGRQRSVLVEGKIATIWNEDNFTSSSPTSSEQTSGSHVATEA